MQNTNNINKAMLFAAGLGTRLGKLTSNTPKALIKVNNKTLLEYALDYLKKYGVTDVIINIHHFPEQIISHVNKIKPDLNISFSKEKKLLETGGGLLKAKHFFNNTNDFILYNTDIYTSLDLNKMKETHLKQKPLASLAVRKRNTSRYLLFDKNMQMKAWENINTREKIICKNTNYNELSAYAFSGIHIVNSNIFDLLKEYENTKFSITNAYTKLACKYKINGFIDNSHTWIDAGKPETLEKLKQLTKS